MAEETLNQVAPVRRRRSEKWVDKVLGAGETKRSYLYKPTVVDKILALSFLRLVPANITPNQVTVFRFVTIPFIVYLLLTESYPAATVLFAFSAFSDAVDGAMARTRKQITSWGIIFDPVADKLLVGLTALILVSKEISYSLAFTIVFIEIALVASVYFRYGGKAVPAKMSGKIKMILQCFGLLFLLLFVNTGWVLLQAWAEYTLYASVVFALSSLFIYKSI